MHMRNAGFQILLDLVDRERNFVDALLMGKDLIKGQYRLNEIQSQCRQMGVHSLHLQGAIVDIGENLPGFLHISQVVDSANPNAAVINLEDVLKVGDTLSVWVKRILKDRVELTMKEPLELEWREIKPDMVLHGKVVRVENFGAFVEIGAERPGLVHVSELSHNYVRVPSEVVKVGDKVDVKVLEETKLDGGLIRRWGRGGLRLRRSGPARQRRQQDRPQRRSEYRPAAHHKSCRPTQCGTTGGT